MYTTSNGPPVDGKLNVKVSLYYPHPQAQIAQEIDISLVDIGKIEGGGLLL